MEWEIDFLKFVIENFHNNAVTEIMRLITGIGNYGFIWILIAVVFIIMPEMRKTGKAMAISLIIVLIVVNVILKPLIDRARPFEINTDILESILISLPGDGSFPSGHTAAAFCGATSAFCCNKRVGSIFFVFAFLMGISRLYFAVHFPTDVIGGIVIGMLSGIAGYEISLKIFRNSSVNKIDKY